MWITYKGNTKNYVYHKSKSMNEVSTMQWGYVSMLVWAYSVKRSDVTRWKQSYMDGIMHRWANPHQNNNENVCHW